MAPPILVAKGLAEANAYVCPVTCGTCGCGLSSDSCVDCADNSDLCLKESNTAWKGYDCESAKRWCGSSRWGRDVLKCCPDACKRSERVSMSCAKSSNKCLQQKRYWSQYSCNDEESKKYCDRTATKWYHSMWGHNWQSDMFTCCPETCANEGHDISGALCNSVDASDSCVLEY